MQFQSLIDAVRRHPRRALLTATPIMATLALGFIATEATRASFQHNATVTKNLAGIPSPIRLQTTPLTASEYQKHAATLASLYPELKIGAMGDGIQINGTDTAQFSTWSAALDAVAGLEASTRWDLTELCLSKTCNPSIQAKVSGRRDTVTSR